uniref:Uncharacterized protein n=1 Tax=Arundo donax TaxID=35708 RepID=A0A0A9GQM3_ARUDO
MVLCRVFLLGFASPSLVCHRNCYRCKNATVGIAVDIFPGWSLKSGAELPYLINVRYFSCKMCGPSL